MIPVTPLANEKPSALATDISERLNAAIREHLLSAFARDSTKTLRSFSAPEAADLLGVSGHTWNVLQDRLGKQVATAALALVFEKHCAGEVSSPGGYLRGMVVKVGAGELHLERSLYGRLSGQAA